MIEECRDRELSDSGRSFPHCPGHCIGLKKVEQGPPIGKHRARQGRERGRGQNLFSDKHQVIITIYLLLLIMKSSPPPLPPSIIYFPTCVFFGLVMFHGVLQVDFRSRAGTIFPISVCARVVFCHSLT